MIGTLRPHCGRELLLLARDVIMSGRGLLSQQKSSCHSDAFGSLLLALLSPSGSSDEKFRVIRESVLGDTCLTAFLEVLAAKGGSCGDRLVGVAYEILKHRTLHSGMDIVPSISTSEHATGRRNHVTDSVKFLAKPLLCADSAVPSKESLLLVGDSIPSCPDSIRASASSALSRPGNKSLSIMLCMLEDVESSGWLEDTAGSRPPFLLGEELMLRLMRSCADQQTPCCVQLLLLLCLSSECGRKQFEESFLREFCTRIRDSEPSNCGTSLAVVGCYLEHLSSGGKLAEGGKGVESVGGALKVVRKLARERCMGIVDSSGAAFSEDQQVCACFCATSVFQATLGTSQSVPIIGVASFQDPQIHCKPSFSTGEGCGNLDISCSSGPQRYTYVIQLP